MDYLDFYDLAEYANNNWRGSFTPREIAENAFLYKTDYDELGSKSEVIQELVYQLVIDNSEQAREWVRRIMER